MPKSLILIYISTFFSQVAVANELALSVSFLNGAKFELVQKSAKAKYTIERIDKKGSVKSKEIPAGLAETILSDSVKIVWTASYSAKPKMKCTVAGHIEVRSKEDSASICREHQKSYSMFMELKKRLEGLLPDSN